MSEEIYSKFKIHEELLSKVKAGETPLEIVKNVILKHAWIVVNITFDLEAEESEINQIYTEQLFRHVRWALGNLIDNLKPCFEGGLFDTLMFLRLNLKDAISEGELEAA